MNEKYKSYKVLGLQGNTLWLIYAIITNSFWGIIGNVFSLISIIIGLIKNKKYIKNLIFKRILHIIVSEVKFDE